MLTLLLIRIGKCNHYMYRGESVFFARFDGKFYAAKLFCVLYDPVCFIVICSDVLCCVVSLSVLLSCVVVSCFIMCCGIVMCSVLMFSCFYAGEPYINNQL